MKTYVILLFSSTILFFNDSNAQFLSNGPTNPYINKIDSTVMAIDTDTSLNRVFLSDTIVRQLPGYPFSEFKSDHLPFRYELLPMNTAMPMSTAMPPLNLPLQPYAFFKDTQLVKIQFYDLTLHFANDTLIRQYWLCARPAGWAYCNGFSSAVFYDYFWYRNAEFETRKIKVYLSSSPGQCDCDMYPEIPYAFSDSLVSKFKIAAEHQL